MSQQNRNSGNRQQYGRGGNDRSRTQQGPRQVPQEFNRGERMNIVFIDESYRGGQRVVSYLSDGTVVVPGVFGDYRFNPTPVSKEYDCSIMFGERGVTALPRFPGDLTGQEWVHEKKAAACITVTLTFRMSVGGNGRPSRLMSRHDNKVVFIDQGRENDVVEGSETIVQLIDKGHVYFAIPVGARPQLDVPKVATSPVKEGGRSKDPTRVDVRVYSLKPGVIVAEGFDDVKFKDEPRSIYTMLSNSRLGFSISADSTAEEVISAAAKTRESLRGYIGGKMNLQKLNVRYFLDALDDSKTRALDLIKAKAKSVKVAESAKKVPDERSTETTTESASVEDAHVDVSDCQFGTIDDTFGNALAATATSDANVPETCEVFEPSSESVANVAPETDLVPDSSPDVSPDSSPKAVATSEVVSDSTPVASAPVLESSLEDVVEEETASPPSQSATIVVPAVVEKASESASAAMEDSDEDDYRKVVVNVNDPNLMGLPAFHKPNSKEQVIDGVRYAISRGKCTDVKTFRALDLEKQKECVRLAARLAKFARKNSQKTARA